MKPCIDNPTWLCQSIGDQLLGLLIFACFMVVLCLVVVALVAWHKRPPCLFGHAWGEWEWLVMTEKGRNYAPGTLERALAEGLERTRMCTRCGELQTEFAQPERRGWRFGFKR